ncbi:MAG: hypothetical protein JWO43_14 [Candidatus Adlerbacteria bacterium]|nr:hypothetical protein [Candidatus Adlerbacteria bacterium]
MKKYVGVGFIATALLFSVSSTAHAAAFTEVQVQSVLNLVVSYGGDVSTVKNVEANLRAQVSTGSTTNTLGNAPCIVLRSNFTVGASDTRTDGEVSKLQQFLTDSGINVPITGYFGPATSRALQEWQGGNGIAVTAFGTGAFGAKSRAKMAEICNAPVSFTYERIRDAGPRTVLFYLTVLPGSYTVDYGDGTSDRVNLYVKSNKNVGHEYKGPGTYTVKLNQSASCASAASCAPVDTTVGTVTVTITN